MVNSTIARTLVKTVDYYLNSNSVQMQAMNSVNINETDVPCSLQAKHDVGS